MQNGGRYWDRTSGPCRVKRNPLHHRGADSRFWPQPAVCKHRSLSERRSRSFPTRQSAKPPVTDDVDNEGERHELQIEQRVLSS